MLSAYRRGCATSWKYIISVHFSATGDIRTIFLTLSGISTATLGGMFEPSLCPINVAFLLAFTSGCCNNTDIAFSASCFRLLNVRFPQALLSDIVKFGPTPLLSYLRTAKPLSERYLAR